MIIKGIRLIEERDGKIFVVLHPYEIRYDLCWVHSYFSNVEFKDFSNQSIIPFVRDHQFKYVIIIYKERTDYSGNDPRFRILKQKECKELYKFAKGKFDSFKVSENIFYGDT